MSHTPVKGLTQAGCNIPDLSNRDLSPSGSIPEHLEYCALGIDLRKTCRRQLVAERLHVQLLN